MTIEEIVAHLRADPACAIGPASTNRPPLPAQLPEEVRQFFSLTSGGHLFYHPDYPTPQFGCSLNLCSEPVSEAMGGYSMSYCESVEFEHLYPVANDLETGEFSVVAVSTMPAYYGRMFWVSYSLGDPTLTWDEVCYLAPSFTRWLSMHLEAWETYQADWREGLRQSGFLIARGRTLYLTPSPFRSTASRINPIGDVPSCAPPRLVSGKRAVNSCFEDRINEFEITLARLDLHRVAGGTLDCMG